MLKIEEALKISGVLEDDEIYEIMEAFVEVKGWEAFFKRVEEKGEKWCEEINLYEEQTMEEVAEDWFYDYFRIGITDELLGYLDFQKFIRDLQAVGFYTYSKGVIEIRD